MSEENRRLVRGGVASGDFDTLEHTEETFAEKCGVFGIIGLYLR